MNRFIDEDGDVWTRGEHRGEVVLSGTVWRLVTDELIEHRDIDEDHWHQSIIDEYPDTGPCMSAAIAALWPETTRPNLDTPPKVEAPSPRRIIQLTAAAQVIAAVCDDGTAWLINSDLVWQRLPAIPQD